MRKLAWTLGHDLANVKVIVKGEGNNSSFYLVDDISVIKYVKEKVEGQEFRMSAHAHAMHCAKRRR